MPAHTLIVLLLQRKRHERVLSESLLQAAITLTTQACSWLHALNTKPQWLIQLLISHGSMGSSCLLPTVRHRQLLQWKPDTEPLPSSTMKVPQLSQTGTVHTHC